MFNRTKVKYYGRGSVLPVMGYWVRAILCFSLFLLGILSLEANPRLHRICAFQGTNTLQWFINKDTCQDLVQIEIFARENQFAPFKKVGNTSSGKATIHSHTGAAAFQNGSYFLHYIIKCGGNDISVYSDTIAVDTRAPETLEPDSVSIVNGKVVIGWTAAKEPDAKSYVIYRTVGATTSSIDTVYGKFNTFYRDSVKGDPTTKTERYKIAAVDSCDNIGLISNYHETVFLQVSADKCRGELYLKWSAYVGWKEVERYDIFINDGLGYKLAGSTGNLQDTLHGLKTNTKYNIFVRAHKKGGGASSSSNVIVHNADFGDVLEYLYISTVTYRQARLRVEWLHADHTELDRFELYRGKDKIRMIKVADLSRNQLFWEENNPGLDIWYFKVKAYNTCGKVLAESNISNSMVLSVTKENDHRILTWNEYATWLNGVGEYNVYKVIYGKDTSGINLLPIGTTDKTTTFFEDTTSMTRDTLPGACYYIEAAESGLNKLGISGLSLSNVICYQNPPIVFIPNAFVPHEYTNTHFKPSLVNVDLANSMMVIYNRWGQRIVENIDLSRGWDGRLSNGNVAPEGVYFYVLTIQGIDGSKQVYNGTITLL